MKTLASLIDIMLLGHWIEMRSVMGASRALEELAKLMPSDVHKLMPDGRVRDVPLSELAVYDKVLIKPGEKIPLVVLPLAAEALYAWGVLLTPAMGAVFMSANTVSVAFNARLLRLKQ